jgi:hypothetical protein
MSPSTIRAQTAAPHAFAIVLGDRQVERLHDRNFVFIRPLRQDDRQRETEFIRRLSLKSQKARFLSEFREPGLAAIDHTRAIHWIDLVGA